MGNTPPRRPSRRYLILALFTAIALYAILPQLGAFKSSWSQLGNVDLGWTVAATACAWLTYFAAAATCTLLGFRPLRYWRTVLVQLAAVFANRLLPAGIGFLGTNYAYLRKNHHDGAQATSLLAVNNLLGFIGHGLLLAGLLLATARPLDAFTVQLPRISLWGWLAVASVVIGLLLTLFIRKVRQALSGIFRQMATYRHRPIRLSLALLSSMTLTAANVVCLYACMQALGVQLPVATVFIIFSFGVGAGTAVPTPGGLGAFEAGLLAGFVSTDVPASTALAIALLFRLITYWLALLLGSIAFVVCERRQLI